MKKLLVVIAAIAFVSVACVPPPPTTTTTTTTEPPPGVTVQHICEGDLEITRIDVGRQDQQISFAVETVFESGRIGFANEQTWRVSIVNSLDPTPDPVVAFNIYLNFEIDPFGKLVSGDLLTTVERTFCVDA